MEFAEYLQKEIYTTGGGIISSKLNINPYRSILIPEEILARYVKYLDGKEKTKHIYLLIKDWCEKIIRSKFSSQSGFSCEQVFNTILKRIWCTTGSMNNLVAKKEGKDIIIQTDDECITQLIGKNNMMPAFFEGAISALTNKKVKLKDARQGKHSKYIFSLLNEDCYNPDTQLKPQISSDEGGFNLKDALSYNLFILKDNKIFFEEKQLILIESSILHRLPNTKEDIDAVSHIAYNFFNELTTKFHGTGKLVLLKKLLQSMGWGGILIKYHNSDIQLQIKSAPKNALGSGDDWRFFAGIILGYLWSLNPNLTIISMRSSTESLNIHFSLSSTASQVELPE